MPPMAMNREQLNAWLNDPHRRPLVMGILNVTPDSFSDGGRFLDPSAAVEAAVRMVAEGADWIDVGGESTRPGSAPVSEADQIARVVPVIRQLKARSNVVVSIDTSRSAVATGALDAGADVVNDIYAGRDDAELLPLAAQRKCPVILMHMQGMPATMQKDPRYADVTREVLEFFAERVAAAKAVGIKPERILLDPGIGFGKTVRHNLTLLRDTRRLAEFGRPLVIGSSRKGFITKVTGETDPADRLFGTAATVAWAVANGCAVARVHDVGPIVRVVRMVRAISAAKIAENIHPQ